MIGKGLRDGQNDGFTGRISQIRICAIHRHPGNDAIGALRIIDIEIPVGGKGRIESEPQETAFAAGSYRFTQKGRREFIPEAIHDSDGTALFDNEQATIPCIGNINRATVSAHIRGELDIGLRICIGAYKCKEESVKCFGIHDEFRLNG